jgi:hypothetical protein
MYFQRYGAPAEVYLFGLRKSRVGTRGHTPRAREPETWSLGPTSGHELRMCCTGGCLSIWEDGKRLKSRLFASKRQTFLPTATYSSRINTKLARQRCSHEPVKLYIRSEKKYM